GLAVDQPRTPATGDMCEAFGKALGSAAALVLTEVYPAGESPIIAADGRALARALRVAGRIEPVFVEDVAEVAEAITSIARDGDLVLTMGAGSIGSVAQQLALVAS